MQLPLITSLLLTLLAPLAVRSQADQRNSTTLTGTWSSGSGAVVTGGGFANPVNFTFTYPKNTGVSWSFTDDGFFEQAEYRFNSNGSQPTCITGIVLFQHGTYEIIPGIGPNDTKTSTIIATPFAADGRLQVQDPCAAKSNTISQFNTTVTFKDWRIFKDPQRDNKLQLYAFDGAPLSPMYLISASPNMLPTQVLTVNLTVGANGEIGINAAVGSLRKVTYVVLGTVAGLAAGVAMLF